jgi:DNA-binding Lrp family transcriptional regulator
MEESSMKLTKNEIKLLNELHKNSSQSNGKLAKKLNVHHTTILRIKKNLEDKLGLGYTINFDLQKVRTHKFYYIFQQLVPGARNNEELDRKMGEYYKHRPYVVGYGKCIHGKWDAFTIFYCSEQRFDEYFNEFKSRINMMTEEMDIIKTAQPIHPSFMQIPVATILE